MGDSAIAPLPASATAGCACACHGEWSAAVVALRQLEEWQSRAAQYITLLENEKAAADAQLAQLQETRATEARAREERVRAAEGAVERAEEERRREGERLEEERRKAAERVEEERKLGVEKVREQAERQARLREVHLQTRLSQQQQEIIRRDRAAMEIHAFWQEAVRERNEALMGTKQAQRELRSRDQADKEKAEVTKALMRQCEECRKEKDSALQALAGVRRENEALEVNLQRQGKVIERLIDLNSELVEGNEVLQQRQRDMERRAGEMAAEVLALRRRVGDVGGADGGGEGEGETGEGGEEGKGARQKEGREQQEKGLIEGMEVAQGRGGEENGARDGRGSSRRAGGAGMDERTGGGGMDERAGVGDGGGSEGGGGEAAEEDGDDGPDPVSCFPTEQPPSLQSHAATSLGDSQQATPSFFAFFSSKPAAAAPGAAAAAAGAPASPAPAATAVAAATTAAAPPTAPAAGPSRIDSSARSAPPGPIDPVAAVARVYNTSSNAETSRDHRPGGDLGADSVRQEEGDGGARAEGGMAAGECDRENTGGWQGKDGVAMRGGGREGGAGGESARGSSGGSGSIGGAHAMHHQQDRERGGQQQGSVRLISDQQGRTKSAEFASTGSGGAAGDDVTPVASQALSASAPAATPASGPGEYREELLSAGPSIGEEGNLRGDSHSDQATGVQHARDTGVTVENNQPDVAWQRNNQKRLGAAWSAVRGNAKGLFSYIVGADKVTVGS
ncbi:unnamed protein product [Closterium sp. Naga37s-1]|nr:unnamed protein product [Closterium sp. Naga37s-1]